MVIALMTLCCYNFGAAMSAAHSTGNSSCTLLGWRVDAQLRCN